MSYLNGADYARPGNCEKALLRESKERLYLVKTAHSNLITVAHLFFFVLFFLNVNGVWARPEWIPKLSSDKIKLCHASVKSEEKEKVFSLAASHWAVLMSTKAGRPLWDDSNAG